MIQKLINLFWDVRKKHYLFTDWEFGCTRFSIYHSYDDQTLITSRCIDLSDKIQWFCIEDLEEEILEYAKVHNIRIKGLKETIKDIHTMGFSYKRSLYGMKIAQVSVMNICGTKPIILI